MKATKILPLLLLGGGLAYAVTQGDKAPVTVPNPSNAGTTGSNTGSGGLQQQGGSSGLIAVSGIQADSQPDYTNWKRAHWAAWYQSLLHTQSPQDANAVLWSAWTSPENPFANYKEHQDKPPVNKFPNVELLAMSLAAFRPDNNIGVINVDANSTPVYDTWSGWWNNLTVWECADWKNWFDAMEVALGRSVAQQRFASAWSHEDNWSFNGAGQYCSSSCTFIEDMTNRGVDVAAFGMRTACNLTNIPYNIVTAGSNVTQGVNNASSAFADVAPFAIYGAAIFLGVKAYKSINE